MFLGAAYWVGAVDRGTEESLCSYGTCIGVIPVFRWERYGQFWGISTEQGYASGVTVPIRGETGPGVCQRPAGSPPMTIRKVSTLRGPSRR